MLVAAPASGLGKDSVVNVSGLVTLDKLDLGGSRGDALLAHLADDIDAGLRLLLDLEGHNGYGGPTWEGQRMTLRRVLAILVAVVVGVCGASPGASSSCSRRR